MVRLNLNEIEKNLLKDPTNPKLWYDKGMALAEENRFDECIPAFSMGLMYAPFDPDLRLQRGRKYITADNYKAAIADINLAARIKPEHWENWYYQGVAAYMCGDYKYSMAAEYKCIQTMTENDVEEIPAPVCWYWQSAMKAGLKEEAQKILDDYIYEGIKCGNMDYIQRCYLYKGIAKPEDFSNLEKLKESLKDEDRPELYFITLCHGLSTFLYYNGEVEKSNELLKTIYDCESYHECFAYKQTLQDMKERGLL